MLKTLWPIRSRIISPESNKLQINKANSILTCFVNSNSNTDKTIPFSDVSDWIIVWHALHVIRNCMCYARIRKCEKSFKNKKNVSLDCTQKILNKITAGDNYWRNYNLTSMKNEKLKQQHTSRSGSIATRCMSHTSKGKSLHIYEWWISKNLRVESMKTL